MKNIKVIGNTKTHFLTYGLVINLLILLLFLFLLPNSMKGNENEDYRLEYEPVAFNIFNGANYNFYDPNFCLYPCIDESNPIDNDEIDPIAIDDVQFRRPPVFPTIIAISYVLEKYLKVKHYDIFLFIQYFLHLSSSLLIFLIYCRWFENFKVAFLASLFYGSYPLGLYLLKQPNSEVVFNFLIVLFIFFISKVFKNNASLKTSSVYLSGFILGLILLTRSIAIFMPILFGVFLLIYYKKYFLKIIFGLTIGASIILIPWKVYVQNLPIKFDNPTNFPEMVFVSGLYWERIPGRESSKISGLMSNNLLHFMEKTYEKSSEDLLDSKGEIYNYLKNEIVESPIVMLELLSWKALRALYATDTRRYEMEVFLINIFYICALLLLFIKRKKYITHRDHKVFSMLAFFIFLYFYGMSFATIPIVRYSISGLLFIVPLISLLLGKYGEEKNNNE